MRKNNSDILRIVYAFFYPSEHKIAGQPCYIGKGYPGRPKDHIRDAKNKQLKGIFNKSNGDLPLVIFREGLTNDEAIAVEIALIAAVGRADKGLGPLVNHTDGGEGVSGLIVSEKTRRRVSETQRGRKASLNTRARMSKSHRERERDPAIGVLISIGLHKSFDERRQTETEEDRLARSERARLAAKALHAAGKGKGPLKGSHLTSEHKEKVSLGITRSWEDPLVAAARSSGILTAWANMTDETRNERSRKLREANLGKTQSEESINKMLETRSQWADDKRKQNGQKIAFALFGRALSDAHVENIRNGVRAAWERKRALKEFVLQEIGEIAA